MKMILLFILTLLTVGCSQKSIVSSDLQSQMKIDCEKQRIDQRDKKIFFIGLMAAYGIIMKKIADSY